MQKKMTKIDARKQTREELFERRKQIIQLSDAGTPVMEIVSQTGMSWSAVNSTIRKYQTEGESSLIPAARGRKQGSGRILSEYQELEIRILIHTKRPWKCQLGYSLWNRDVVAKLIKNKFGIELSERVLGDYLKRWGLSLKFPNKRGSERCTQEIRIWLATHYTSIEEQAKIENAEIYWVNKPIALDPALWITSNTPLIPQKDAMPLKKAFMFSVVNNQGKISWVVVKGPVTPDRQILILKALIKETVRFTRRRKVFLIRSDNKFLNSSQFNYWIRHEAKDITIFPPTKAASITSRKLTTRAGRGMQRGWDDPADDMYF